MTALVTLEAAVRHRSFTVAARELGVTQAAVSRQIGLLEGELGVSLFVRGHRAIEPTASCLALGTVLAESFADIAYGVETIRSAAANEVVTIGATLAFSTFWLLPRLSDFRQSHPHVQIRIISQDSKVNLGSGEVDIAIRYGVPPFSDGTVIASCGDTIAPVCSPDYARRLSAEPFWEGRHDLISADAPDRSWYDWRDWFAHAGRKGTLPEPSLRFSHYTEAIAAARAGQGVALGWSVLVDTFIGDGSLVRIGDTEIVANGRYNVITPFKARRSQLRDALAGWLTASLHS